MPAEFIRECFRNTESLLQYRAGGTLCPQKLNQLIFQGLRRRNPNRPDHLIKNRQQLFSSNDSSLEHYLINLFDTFFKRFIDISSNGQLLVKPECFEEWQNVITEVPPLLGVSWAIYREVGAPNLEDKESVSKYFKQYINPQVKFSALPSIKDPRLDELIERVGLDDLHLHLNGSTEIEVVWRGALKRPRAFTKELKWAKGNQFVEEQYNADEIGLDQQEQFKRLIIANKLRNILLDEAINSHVITQYELNTINIDVEFNCADSNIETEFGQYVSHLDTCLKTPLALEALFLITLFKHLDCLNKSNRKNSSFSNALYYYLLIKCQFMRLIVQQTQQYGFEQFQKITFNEMRRSSEVEYVSRFKQLSYSEAGDVTQLEGRFAPKSQLSSNKETVGSIIRDYKSFQISEAKLLDPKKEPKDVNNFTLLDLLSENNIETGRLKLSLIAHFIKKSDRRKVKLSNSEISISWQCRHFELRNEVEKNRRAIGALNTRYKDLSNYLVGFDAAASELDAEPEVFAPVFRRLRTSGHHNFTFHAGEDYVHLLSGIRTVDEAVRFLDLKTGNRIGHGTAIGISPKLWRNRVGSTIVMKQGQRLDDLVYAHRMLAENGAEGRILFLIESQIRKLCSKVYGEVYTSEDLFDAWKLRYIDPILAFELKRDNDSYLRIEIIDEIDNIEEQKSLYEKAFEIFSKYHGANGSSKVVKRYEELAEFDLTCPCEQAFTSEAFRVLQKNVLKKLNRRQMAIESLPTSNLRISFYKSYSEHHIFDWLGLDGCEKGMEVPVVLGTDDPGIFSTNLRNEYAHILIELDKRMPPIEAITQLERIAKNGKIWRFKN